MNRKHACTLLLLLISGATLFGADESPFQHGEGKFIPEGNIGVEDILPSPPCARRRLTSTNPSDSFAFREHNFKRPVALKCVQEKPSPFGLKNHSKRKVSKVPSFAMPCSVLPEDSSSNDTSLEEKIKTIESIFKEMRLNGLKRDTQFKDLENYIRASLDPITEAEKIIKNSEETVKQAAKERLYSLEKLINQTKHETDNHFTLPEDSERLLKRSQIYKKSPVDQLRTLQTVSPIIFQYAADNQERMRLKQLIKTALTSLDTINEKDRDNITDTLKEIEKTSSSETQLTLLRELHRTYITKKRKVKSPVNFADKMTEEHEFVAQAHELKTMHGLDNAWGNNKLHRGPSPDELEEIK